MPTWIDELADSLGVPPLTEEEVAGLLSLAGDVAHRVERRVTPLSTFLLGMAVARGEAGGAGRRQSMEAASGVLRGLLPDVEPDRTAGSSSPSGHGKA
jgi:hypothetical protein